MRGMTKIVVVGAAGFGRETLDVLSAIKNDGGSLDVLGVIDDAPSNENLARLEHRGVHYLGTLDEWLSTNPREAQYVIGIGNPSIRKRLATCLDNAGLQAFTAVHPSAVIGDNTVIGLGAVICAGAVISTNVVLKDHVHINPHVTVGHDSILGDFVSLNPACVISGAVQLDSCVLVGASATILQNLNVGELTTVGAGALVTKNVPGGVIVKGLPGVWND